MLPTDRPSEQIQESYFIMPPKHSLRYHFSVNSFRNHFSQGTEWKSQRAVIFEPLQCSVLNHIQSLDDVCDIFTRKLYNVRNYQDEVTKDLTTEIHKWAFDSLGEKRH